MKQDNDVNQNMLQNLEEAISIIPEVDESNQTTEEKYKSKSPTWGRLKKSKRQEELDKIPFEIEDTKEPSKEIKFRIGSVKKLEHISIQNIPYHSPIDESIQTEQRSNNMSQSLQTDSYMNNDSKEELDEQNLQTEDQIVEAFDQDIQTDSVKLDRKDVQTDHLFVEEQNIQTDYVDSNEQDMQTSFVSNYEQDVQTSVVEVNDQDVQADYVQVYDSEAQTECVRVYEQDAQTDHVEFCEQDAQTNHFELYEQDVQTDHIEQNEQDAQTDYIQINEQDVQTLMIEWYEQNIQTEQEEEDKIATEDVEVQSDPIPKVKICYNYTQTDEEEKVETSSKFIEADIKPNVKHLQTQTLGAKTRTGGVQVTIGNVFVRKRLKLTNIISKIIAKSEMLDHINNMEMLRHFEKWRSFVCNMKNREQNEIAKEDNSHNLDLALLKLQKVVIDKNRNEKLHIMNKLKENTIKCMMFDQFKYIEMEDEFKQTLKESQSSYDKNLYLEDLIKKKDKDYENKQKELTTANKKIQELNKIIEEMKNQRKSSGSLSGRYDANLSSVSQRKSSITPTVTLSTNSKRSQYFSSSKSSRPSIKNKTKSKQQSATQSKGRDSGKDTSVKNLKANT